MIYDFTNPDFYGRSDIKSLVTTINLLGDDLIGVELGVFRAQSFCTLLHNCKNIKTLYGVDSYKPYADYLKSSNDTDYETPAYVINQKTIDEIKKDSYNKISNSGMTHKVIFYEQDSNDVVKNFKEESIDFIFIDTYLTEDQVKTDIETWYPIVKKGGLFSGHDWGSIQVQRPLLKFRKENGIQSRMSTFDDCWSWIKS